MKKENKILFFTFIYLFVAMTLCITAVTATKPSLQNIITSDQLQIVAPAFDMVPKGSNYTFYWHVYDFNGTKLTNTTTSCIFHMYQNSDGSHIVQRNGVMDSNNVDWEVIINNSVLTKNGQYHYLIQCNQSNVGGFSLYDFEVGDINIDRKADYLPFVLALIFVISLLIMWAYKLEKEHIFLKLFLVIFAFISLQLLPTLILKSIDIGTAQTFYKIWVYLYRAFITYVFAYLLYFGGKQIMKLKGWLK